MFQEERRRRFSGLPPWQEAVGTIEYREESTQKVRAGFIGCGGHSYRNIFPAFHFAPVELVAICDVAGDRARSYANEFGAQRWYVDYKQMLQEEELDCAFVVTNYDEEGQPRYPRIAMDIMEAGCHAWIEKPPAANSTVVEEMMATETATGKFTQVGYKKMFAASYTKAKEISQRPEFGGLTQLTVRYPQALPAPEKRFSLADTHLAVSFLDHIFHPMSIMQLLGGDISSMIYNWEENSGGMMALFQFRTGAIGSLHSSGGQSRYGPREHVEVIGNGAHVVIDNGIRFTYYRHSQGHHYGRSPDFFTPDDEAPLHWEPEFSLGVLYNSNAFILGYVPQIRTFCENVLANERPKLAGLRDTWAIMQVYEAFRQPQGTLIEFRTTPSH